jgi:hypothetical protein
VRHPLAKADFIFLFAMAAKKREELPMPDNTRTKFVLDEDEMPRAWYNIMADRIHPPRYCTLALTNRSRPMISRRSFQWR